MSANFWQSTHNKNWLFTKEKVEKDYERNCNLSNITPIERKKLHIYFAHYYITALGRAVNLRQRVIASAIVYWKRFYLNYSFSDMDPSLIGGTCLYLASKVEECITKVDNIVNHMKTFDFELNLKFREYQNADLIHYEFYVMDGLKCQLVLYHPYNDLQNFLVDADLLDYKEDAWKLLNDTYKTDLPLMFPPHIIALGCIYLCSFIEKGGISSTAKIAKWLAGLSVELKDVGVVVQEMVELYEIWGENETLFKMNITEMLMKKLRIPGITSTPSAPTPITGMLTTTSSGMGNQVNMMAPLMNMQGMTMNGVMANNFMGIIQGNSSSNAIIISDK